MRLLCLLSILSFAACVDAASRPGGTDTTTPADTSPAADTAVEPDTAQPEILANDVEPDEDGDADTVAPDPDGLDTAITADGDTQVPDVNTVREMECLPEGCTAPSGACPVSPDFCFLDGACYATDTVHPSDSCRACRPKTAVLAWTVLGNGEVCDDGASCTRDDVCKQGVCKGEVDCPSSLACVTPTCNAVTDACEDVPDSGRCFVDGVCFSEGQVTGDRCKACRTDVSQTSLTPGDAAEPDDDIDYGNGLSHPEVAVTGGGDQDPGWEGPWTTSTLSPATDLDAFGFIYDTNSSFSRPTVKVALSAAHPVEVCMYIRCLPINDEQTRPTPSMTCGGTETKKVKGDWVGCCRPSTNAAIEMTPVQVWCERAGNMVNNPAEVGVTLRHNAPGAPMCLPYTLRWGFR